MAKFITAKEAAELIPNGITLGTNGFLGTAFPEEIAQEIENRFLETQEPRDLTLYFCAAQGDNKTKGLQHMGHEGLICRVIGAHFGLARRIGELITQNKIEAYAFPQGVVARQQCATAAHQPGVLTNVGIGTFIDPRLEGGKMNEKTKAAKDLVELVNFHGEEYLFYKSIPVDCAIFAGTYADEDGNISFEREGVKAEALALSKFRYVDIAFHIAFGKSYKCLVKATAVIKIKDGGHCYHTGRIQTHAKIEAALRVAAKQAIFHCKGKLFCDSLFCGNG